MGDLQVGTRAAMYGRVSAVMGRGEELTSPELQERAVREYCARRGYEPVVWLCDVDQTGTSWSRRQVEQAVRMIEEHKADLIVVPRWSRFTRNLRDYVMQTARIEAAGGRLESALEETDPATAAGLLQRDLFAILAQWESRKIGEQWKETHQRRLREGLPHHMHPRLGYRIVNGRYRRHPTEGPVVTELYDRYLAGSGVASLTHWLAGKGIVSRVTGERWTPRGLSCMLTSGFSAGWLHIGDGYQPGAHTALITPAVWERYQQVRAARRCVAPRNWAAPTALAGLVYCGNCGRKMRLKDQLTIKHGSGRGYLYVCDHRGECDLPATMTRHRLEAHVGQWLKEVADEASRTAPESPALSSARFERSRLHAQLSRLDTGLVKNRAEYAIGEYDKAMRDRIEADLKSRQRQLRLQVEELAAHGPLAIPKARDLQGLVDHWTDWPPGQLNNSLIAVISRVSVLRLPGRRQNHIAIDTQWDDEPPSDLARIHRVTSLAG